MITRVEPITVAFLLISLWTAFAPSPEPVCKFTSRVAIKKGRDEVEGYLEEYYVCDTVEIVENLGVVR